MAAVWNFKRVFNSQARSSQLTGILRLRKPYDLVARSLVHTLTRNDVENINKSLTHRLAKVLVPEHTDTYKGLMILSAGPMARYTALKHFSVPYLNEGFAVINMFHSKLDFGFHTPALLKMNKLFSVLSSNLSPSCPIIVKLYCGGSTTYLPSIVKHFANPACKLKLAGLILDSGPPLLGCQVVLSSSRMFKETGKYPMVFHRLILMLVPLMFMMINANTKKRVFERAIDDPFLHSVPQLYVYSLSDLGLDMQYIHAMIDDQKKGGADVSVHTFPDSIHMLHRIKYPKEYDDVVFQFLRSKCNFTV